MKKNAIILLVMLLAFVISACGGETIGNDTENQTNNTEISIDAEEEEPNNTVEETNSTEETNYEKISAFMKDDSEKAFSRYYELLDFQRSNYEEELVDGSVEAIFFYTLIVKDYDSDPDTVDYIKEAKESGKK